MGRLTAVGPAGLVPAAWAVTAAAHTGAVRTRTLFVALLVMSVLLAAFFLAARAEMSGPVLGVWRRVLLAGLFVTLAGTADLAQVPTVNPLAGLTVYAWMVFPGVAYLRTGRAMPELGWVYLLGGALSFLGAGVYAFGAPVSGGPVVLAGIALVGVGQTAGIVTAVLQNTGRLAV